jgi:hypothetical protein
MHITKTNNISCLILLIYRPRHFGMGQSPNVQTSSWEVTLKAAGTITRITNEIMNHGTLTDCPLFL